MWLGSPRLAAQKGLWKTLGFSLCFLISSYITCKTRAAIRQQCLPTNRIEVCENRMRWIPGTIEFIGCAALVALGLYGLYRGTADQVPVLLISGATGVALGLGALFFVIRNTLWHRQRLDDSDF